MQLFAATALILCASSAIRTPVLEATRNQILSLPSALNAGKAKTLSPGRRASGKAEVVRPKPAPEAATSNDEIPERRYDEDGGAYTKEQFLAFYGEVEGKKLWQAAEAAPEDVSYAVEVAELEAEEAKQSALARLRRSAMKEITKLRQTIAETAESAASAAAELAEAAAQFAGFKEKAAGELSEAEGRAVMAEQKAAAARSVAQAERSQRLEAEVSRAVSWMSTTGSGCRGEGCRRSEDT